MARQFSRAATAASALLLLALAGCAQAYPPVWASMAADCVAAPENSFPGATPRPDEETVLTMKRLASSVTKMCPGMPHKLLAQFPEPRQYLFTSTQGTFSNVGGPCPNRALGADAKQTVGIELSLPCDAAGDVTISLMSSAAPESKAYKQVSYKLPVNPVSSCPASPCNAAAAGAGAADKLESGSFSAEIDVPAADASVAVDVADDAAPAAAAGIPAALGIISQLLPGSQQKEGPGAQFLQMLQKFTQAGGNTDNGADSSSDSKQGGGLLNSPINMPKFQLPQINIEALPKLNMEQLQQVNTTAVVQALRTLGKVMPSAGEGGRLDMGNVMEFVKTVNHIVPGQVQSAPDVPTALLNLVKSMGKLLPNSEPVDMVSVVDFLRASGDLIGKLATARGAAAAASP